MLLTRELPVFTLRPRECTAPVIPVRRTRAHWVEGRFRFPVLSSIGHSNKNQEQQI